MGRSKGKGQSNSDPMLDIKEMANTVGVSVHYLYHYKNQHGRLPWDSFLVTATKRVAKKSVVLAWLEANRIPASKEEEKSQIKEVVSVA